MTSGFCFDDNNNQLYYMVGTDFYNQEDDIHCFELSSSFHGVENKKLDDNYIIMRANIEYDECWSVLIEFDNDGKYEYRVYKVIDIQQKE